MAASPATKKQSPTAQKGQKTLLSFFQKSPLVAKKPSRPAQSSPLQPPSASIPSSPPKPQRDVDDLPTPRHSAGSSSVTDDLTIAPALSTPEPSSQIMPSSSPTKVGRRGKRRMVMMDSDSEDGGYEDSDDDWAKKAASDKDDDEEDDDMAVDDDDAEEENELNEEVEEDDEELEDVKPKRVKKNSRSSPTSLPTSSDPPASSPSRSVSPSSVAASLTKFTRSSDYTAATASSQDRQLPLPKKVRVSEDPERYKWLLNVRDADGHSPDDPDYDPRTIHVPKSAWAKFTPFEKQYWEVKQNLWNTVVFFKKGKFYELYENDAAIAHQQFDLKLAGGGRANMSLCGVPEMSFDYWASAFIAKGYKVARVDQAETALSKEMRDIANRKKEDKIIKRELSCVLTGGTLTDAAMLVSDLSQYCMAVAQDGLRFAACFVDTATAHFHLAEFTEKSGDFALLETLLAQTRPKELVVARGGLDRYALKVMRNTTSVDTLWETMKPGSEFWDGETARRELGDMEDVFTARKLPAVLASTLESSDLGASAVGGLVSYLRSLKLDRQLLALGRFSSYDATATAGGRSMVLDGQTLQNLEIFANTWDGGSDGTLFRLVNKCITPAGKRRLRSWVAHPLQRAGDISQRADAVDMLMEQNEVASTLSTKLIGLPDVERMLSRVHAGLLRPRDFVRLVGGLESIARLLTWLQTLTTQLPQLLPFAEGSKALEEAIEPWLTAFDHRLAKDEDLLVPEPGVDADFDRTKQEIDRLEGELADLLKTYRREFKSNMLEYRDSGKEVYLVEVPTKLVRQVPSSWQQMGATAKFKRYWSPEGKQLVRELQEAQEHHKLSVQAVQQKLYARFSGPANYDAFMAASHVASAIDCLLSLARTSQSMAVHCRPEFVEYQDDGGVVEFTELRHPVATSTDFIPNDVKLGDGQAGIALVTGANAAGKSTVLRTTACAILLAQLGCHVPAQSARLSPVDRIMTRLGASDNIFAGKSTFHLELAETERVLAEATARSFVVVDELGRGGSSSNGFAIAEAVLHHLATHSGCLGFFATHYATLYDSFSTHPNIVPKRMAIDVDRKSRLVTFLYRLEPGRSEGSFGMNVAAMCGVGGDIVAAAETAADEYEHTSILKRRAEENSASFVPLGLESDVVASLGTIFSDRAIDIMLEMAAH